MICWSKLGDWRRNQGKEFLVTGKHLLPSLIGTLLLIMFQGDHFWGITMSQNLPISITALDLLLLRMIATWIQGVFHIRFQDPPMQVHFGHKCSGDLTTNHHLNTQTNHLLITFQGSMWISVKISLHLIQGNLFFIGLHAQACTAAINIGKFLPKSPEPV